MALTENQHFLFGITTGIAIVATIQYLVSLASSASTSSSSSLQNQSSNGLGRGTGAPLHRTTSSIMEDPRFEDNLAHSRSATPGLSSSVLHSLESHLTVSSSKLQKIVLHLISEMKKGI